MAYQEKLVAFIDLLGFKELNKEVSEKDTIHNILKTNEELIKIIESINSEQKIKDDCSIKIFSDSIFFSYPKEMFTALLKDLSLLSYKVAKQGYFFRGGLTFGKVFDTGNSLYGPAVIDAYELESKTAFYPRIILKKDLLKNIYLTKEQILDITDNRLLLRDFDDQVFLNYLYNTCVILTDELRTICDNITLLAKKNNKNPTVLPKYLWLINHFNCQLEHLKKKYPKEYYEELHNVIPITLSFKQKPIKID